MNPIPDASAMNDSEFNSLLRNARRAAARLDFSREEYGFATRMHQIASTTAPDLRPVQFLRWWATAAAATATLAAAATAVTGSGLPKVLGHAGHIRFAGGGVVDNGGWVVHANHTPRGPLHTQGRLPGLKDVPAHM